MSTVHHRYATVDGHRLFYREAGDHDAPAVVLLHGFPTSSHMFRHLIPRLADHYHVIAPDMLGFGLSDAPTPAQFDYTFDGLASLTARLLADLGVHRYAMYVQDYGAPVGWRLALGDPDAITAIVTQNGNGYDAGFVEDFWKTVWAYQEAPTPETEAPLRDFLSLEATRWQYVTGVDDETLVDPEAWQHDFALLSRSLEDTIAEPRRAPLVPGLAAIKQAAKDAGALGSSLSGSGPSLFALCRGDETATRVAAAMNAAIQQHIGGESQTYISRISGQGARVVATCAT